MQTIMLLGRETHNKDELLLFTFIRVTAIHARQQSPGASHSLRLSQFWLSRTLKFLLPLVVIGTAVSRLNILFQAVLHLHHISIHTRIHTHIHRCIYIDAHTQIPIHIHRCTYEYAHIYTPYTCKYTYIHSIHIHTHTMEWIIDAPL